jgi:PAS domain-containing protein
MIHARASLRIELAHRTDGRHAVRVRARRFPISSSPQIDYVMQGKGSTWDEDRLVPVTRNGRLEDVWWTYGYNPIDEEGRVAGVLVICMDVTQQHLSKLALERQMNDLQDLFEQAPGFMAVLRGPDHVFALANASYRALVGDRPVQGCIDEVEEKLAAGTNSRILQLEGAAAAAFRQKLDERRLACARATFAA